MRAGQGCTTRSDGSWEDGDALFVLVEIGKHSGLADV